MPVALAKLKETYGLTDVENKMFFPHYYNKEINYENSLTHLPSKDSYGM